MSECWCPVKVKELGTVITGKTPPTKDKHNFGKGYPFIKPPDLSENTRTIKETETEITKVGLSTLPDKLIPPKSTCVVCIGSIGKKIGLTSLPSITNQQINSIVVNQSSYDPFFVYYLLRAALPQVKQLDAGSASGRENVNKSTFENIEVCVPSIELQRKIASVLSPYDDLIENNIRRIEILEEMAQTIYNEWFVKFRFPGHENVKMVDSELGMIPEGWDVKNLGEITLNFDRLRKPLSSMQRAERKGIYPYYGAAKVFDYIDDYIFDGIYLLLAEDGSVVTPDRRPVLQYVSGKFWANNHTHILQGKGYVTTEFLYLVLSEVDIIGYITGAAQPKITQANLNRIPVVVPDDSILQHFTQYIVDIFQQKNVLHMKNATLCTTRDLLLPRLLSGEIDVSELCIDVSKLDIDVGGITA